MIDPATRKLLDMIEQRGLPALHRLPPAEARRVYRERSILTRPDPPQMASVTDAVSCGTGAGIPLRIYRPDGSRPEEILPVLVYFHGGGHTIGDLDTHDVLCRQLCNGSRCCVISVAYRLAPEHKYPAAVEDSLAATYWIARNAASLRVDASRLAVGGDSAGANLAAVVAISARDAGDLPIAYQLLIYPVTDMRAATASHGTNGRGYLLTSETVHYYRDQYLERPEQKLEWRASPLLRDDLSRLPPALVLTAGLDPLQDEGLIYADALSQAGNCVTYVCFDRQIHGFILMGRVIHEANSATALCAAELSRALNG